jgi:hypothetical protein
MAARPTLGAIEQEPAKQESLRVGFPAYLCHAL